MSSKVERYEESSNQFSASIIEEIRNSVYEKHPFSRQDDDDKDWIGSALTEADTDDAIDTEEDAFLKWLKISLFGGFVLVVLMLIMTLHPTLLTVLLTTSVFVFAVAVIIAVQMKTAEDKDVLGTTAAYAAVLVVFVGTTTFTETLKKSVIAFIVTGVIVGCTFVALASAVLLTFIRYWKEVDQGDLPGGKLKWVLRKGLHTVFNSFLSPFGSF
jgi:hypothetical protein